MKIQDNCSDAHLLFGQDVTLICADDAGKEYCTTLISLPKFKHLYFDYKFQTFIHLLQTPIHELSNKLKLFTNFDSFFKFCISAIATSQSNQWVADIVIHTFTTFVQDFHCEKGQMFINIFPINQEIFNHITNLFLVAINEKQLRDLSIIDPAIKAMEDKINAIKKTNKKEQQSKNSNFLDNYMILTYEFNYSPDQILNMTFYAISNILKYTSASISYKVSLIGAGNGLAKKIKFITQKGK